MTAGPAAAGRFFRPDNLHRLARWGLLLAFVWLTGRFWHPYYGFTRFVQFDDSDAAVTLPELRDEPIYVNHFPGGYDGVAYAQLAARPEASGPALQQALDSLQYRARRILLSWIAYAVARGDPGRAVQVYAGLNLVVWFGLAWLLARLFPPQGWRNLVAWVGILFSAGALHSVRLALTDLAAFGLAAAAVILAERKRENVAALVLGAAGLVRETALLAAVALWRGSWREERLANLARLAVAAVPLGLWLVYLKLNTGPVAQGMNNLQWPALGWVGKLTASVRSVLTESDKWLALTTLLAFTGITVQLVYLILHRQPGDRWWRLGAVYVVLLLSLSTAVWEGHPGAATRVLLPLALAFNVVAVRRSAAVGWLLAGNLSVFAGVQVLWDVPRDAHELAAGRAQVGAYVVHTDERWYALERGRNRSWAWCGTAGGLQLDISPRAERIVSLRLAVRGFTARTLEIRQEGRVLWTGRVEESLRWIELPAVTVTHGRARLEVAGLEPPVLEGPAPGARALGFAVYGVRVD